MKNHHHNGPIHAESANARSVIHETIAARAHELWESAGKPADQSEAFWLAAEQELVTGHRALPVELALPVAF